MKKEKYKFGIKENKDLGYKAVVLGDDTHIVFGKEVTIMYPKKKFSPIFKKQMKSRKRKYIGVSFSKIELEAIMKGIKMLEHQSKKGVIHKGKKYNLEEFKLKKFRELEKELLKMSIEDLIDERKDLKTTEAKISYLILLKDKRNKDYLKDFVVRAFSILAKANKWGMYKDGI